MQHQHTSPYAALASKLCDIIASVVTKINQWTTRKRKAYTIKLRLEASEYAGKMDKKLSYCWETVRRESMPRIAEMDVKMIT